MPITLRPVTPEDDAFLYTLYASTRIDEIAGLGWDAGQQEAFLRLQFTGQQERFRGISQEASHHIIRVDGQPAGRILVYRTPAEIRLADIALLPEHRSRGVGTALIEDLKSQAAREDRCLTLHVVRGNRAIRLYQRLGFAEIGATGMHLKMEWAPVGPDGGGNTR